MERHLVMLHLIEDRSLRYCCDSLKKLHWVTEDMPSVATKDSASAATENICAAKEMPSLGSISVVPAFRKKMQQCIRKHVFDEKRLDSDSVSLLVFVPGQSEGIGVYALTPGMCVWGWAKAGFFHRGHRHPLGRTCWSWTHLAQDDFGPRAPICRAHLGPRPTLAQSPPTWAKNVSRYT